MSEPLEPISPLARRQPQARVGLFVDTQNLYYSARDLQRDGDDGYGKSNGYGKGKGYNNGYGNYYVDYQALAHYVGEGRQLQFATAYVVEREGDSGAHGFIAKLSSLGYRVRRKLSRLRYTNDYGEPIFEGDWDMGIAADIVRALEHLDVIALASGDGDFVPILHLAQERGLRVEAYGFRHTTSQALIDCADIFANLAELPDLLL